MTARASWLCLFVPLLSFAHMRAAGPTLYVSPSGNDAWTGRSADANADRTDGPFATPGRARDELRALRKGGASAGGTIFLRGGTYRLAKELTLSPEDSGSENAPVIFAAYSNELPIVSGGVRIDKWEVVEKRWLASLPEVKSGDWNFIQLFVTGERRTRPRLPKSGWHTIEGELPRAADTPGRGHNRFTFRAGNLDPHWANLGDVEVLAVHNWSMSRMRIKTVDPQARQVAFTGSSPGADAWAKFLKGNRFIVENVREALDEPGAWYLDRPTGMLTYLPRPGETPATTEIVAPRAPQLLVLQGDPAGNLWVEHIIFRGIRFAHTNWTTPAQGHSFSQAEADVPAAISAIGARYCALEKCDITLVGGYGIELGAGCRFNRVEECELTDLGGGGIKIGHSVAGGGARPKTDSEYAGENIVRDCLIEGGGRLHPAGIGIWIGHSPRNLIEHNEIADLYYTGISLGWSWGYAPSRAEGNLIAFNRIRQIGQGVLSDMGGIYTLGNGLGNILRHNFISNVESSGYGGWGIYFDEGSTGFLAEDNVVFRTKSGGFHQHYGRENIVRNNIIAFGREAQLIRSRNEPHISFTLEQNIVLADGAPFFGSEWNSSNYKLARNLYWDTTGKTPLFPGGLDLAAWQAKGADAGSIIADPLFEDSVKGDFRFKAGSPAAKIGFKPIDTATTGRRTKRRSGTHSFAPGFAPLGAPTQ